MADREKPVGASRTWRTEFRSGYDIPSIVLFLVEKGLIEDMSWHNDMSPSFGVHGIVVGTRGRAEGYGTREIRLFVEDPIRSQRQGDSKRFLVTVTDSEGDFTDLEYDELEEALEQLIGEIERNSGSLEELPKAWEPLIGKRLHPAEILGELLEDYRGS